MRHHSKNRTLGRVRRQRTALLRGLALSLIEHEKIVTTEAKAKELRPYIEHLVTHAKNDTVSARRRVLSALGEPTSKRIVKLFTDIATRYKDRPGGYTRIIKMGRTQAGRDEAVIEFV